MSISCGLNHSMIITLSGMLFAAGQNYKGQLGLGHNDDRNTFTRVTDISGTPISVSCGDEHSMIITSTGLFATGFNNNGQLGLGDNNNRNTFTKVTGISGTPQSVSCGSYHSMVVTSTGLFVTGNNSEGQLGLGSTGNINTFTKITTTNVTGVPQSVSCGFTHSMVITSTGLFATGANTMGQLGLGTYTSINTFTQVTGLSGTPKSVSCGGTHSMIIISPYNLYGTGNNFNGQLGITSQYINSFRGLATNTESVSCGGAHSMIITLDGRLFVTGYNQYGQLGLGNTNNVSGLTQVMGITKNLQSVSCSINAFSSYNSMFITSTRTLFVTGYNQYGQLGLGDTNNRNYFTRVVTSNSYYGQIAAISGNTNIDGDVNIIGTANIGLNATVLGDANINGNANMNGSANIGGNATIGGDANMNTLTCGAITYYNPNIIFDPTQVGYRLAGSNFASVANVGTIKYYVVFPTAANAGGYLRLNTDTEPLCSLNKGVYLFTLDMQINNYGAAPNSCSIFMTLEKVGSPNTIIIVRGDNAGYTGSLTGSTGTTFCRVLTFSIADNNTSMLFSFYCGSGATNAVEGLNMSITKIA